MLVLLKHLKKHANVFQQGGSPCLSSFKTIHLENDLHLRTQVFQNSRVTLYLKKSDVNDLVVANYQLSRRARTQGTLFLPPLSTAGLRALIQSEHNHHGSDAALLLFGISYTPNAEPRVEMKKHSKVLDSP